MEYPISLNIVGMGCYYFKSMQSAKVFYRKSVKNQAIKPEAYINCRSGNTMFTAYTREESDNRWKASKYI